MNPWFTHPRRSLVAVAAGSEKVRFLPSRRMRVQVLEGDSLADIEVPRGFVEVTLLASASPYPWPGIEHELDVNTIAVSFEERGAGELPRYEPWGMEGVVEAVAVRVNENETQRWSLETVAEQRPVGPVTLWIADASALDGMRELQDVVAADGQTSSFYVRRVTQHQPGVGCFSHSALAGIFLNVAQQKSSVSERIDGRVRIWTGRDRDSNVTELVVDLAAGARRVQAAAGVDPWLDPVFGSLTLSDDADFASLVSRSEPFWIPAYVPGAGVGVDESDPRIRSAREDDDDEHYLPEEVSVRPVGSIPLAGDLALGSVRSSGEVPEGPVKPVRLGLAVAPAVYPAYLVDDSELGDSALLVRFDVGLPVRWSYAPGVLGETRGWPFGDVVLFTDQTDVAARSARPIDHSPTRWTGEGSGALVFQPGHSDSGVFEVYVGYDDSDLPVALVLDLINMVGSGDTHVNQ